MLGASCTFGPAMNAAPAQQPAQTAAEVAEKVMRRVEIAKVARNLQDCLAFASFKAQNGWQDRTLQSIEPEITEKLMRRKRPYADNDQSSNHSGHHTSTTHESRKRVRASSTSGMNRPSNIMTWKEDHCLAQSSPVDHNSFESSYPTLEDSPMFDAPSASDDEDNHMHAMHEPSSSVISSSPPRTPPPNRRMPTTAKQAGADLLLYLPQSPRSPTVHVTQVSSSSKNMPSTPPSQHTRLASAAMHTPGQNFNFADFCNVTPSPAQARWGVQTPVVSKTPARLARRGLNFDSIVPPTSNTQPTSSTTQGLALQLGGELLPRP